MKISSLPHLLIRCVVGIVVAMMACQVRYAAADFTFSFAGHTYQLVTTGQTWINAATDATSRSLGGVTGELARIDSQAENDAITAALSANIPVTDFSLTLAPDGGGSYVWIGATDRQAEGQWIWGGDGNSSGDQFWQGDKNGTVVGGLFNLWGATVGQNEPDNFLSSQDVGGISLNGWPLGLAGQWNDIDETNKLYYLVEFATMPGNPVACFDTNLGNFCVEMFAQRAPQTFANFLRYVDNGSYQNSIFHRSVPGFIVQGGGFTVESNADGSASVTPIDTFEPVVNEFGIPNTRGTVAMAKLGGDPNSATSQWFVNLIDNTANLDSQNGGFTVFGQVLGEGMKVIDKIADSPITNFGGALSATPTTNLTINFDSGQPKIENFVRINQVEVASPSGIFKEDVLFLQVKVGADKFFDVRLQLVSVAPNFVFELDFDSIVSLQTSTAGVATFSAEEGLLKIASVIVDDSFFVHNVTLTLTDAAIFQFTLLSFE